MMYITHVLFTSMAKTNSVICAALMVCAMSFMLVSSPLAYADSVEVQVTASGFSQGSITINSGDTVTFVNTHVKANGNIEPHCISDPFAQPYTEESCWIIDGSTPSISYQIHEDQIFHDRYFTSFSPIGVSIGEGITTETTYVSEETTIDSAPEYNGELSSDMAEIANNLTSALETISNLQTQLAQKQSIINTLQSEVNVLESQVIDVAPYEQQISSLTVERDQWKQTAENWYGVALEQMRVMVEVLGL